MKCIFCKRLMDCVCDIDNFSGLLKRIDLCGSLSISNLQDHASIFRHIYS